jgi:MarR family transcriptional regulator for hemolysin
VERSIKRELLLAVVETSRHLRHFIDRRAQRHGLTGAQLRVLSRLKRREGMMQSELAADLEMRPMSAGGLIDKLVGHGLVERRRDASDRRINRVYLSLEGREAAARLDDFRESVAREVLDGIDEKAIKAALATLGKLKLRLQAGDGMEPFDSSSHRDESETAVTGA